MSSATIGGLTPEEFEYYADGAWYDAEYAPITADIPYYCGVAGRTRGPILELACGTGRLTFPMVRTGSTVHGVDLAPAMIARANEKREKLSPADQARVGFRVADMRTVRTGAIYQAVILAFNTIMHMTGDEDLAAVLETVRAHLAPDGLFYCDLHAPHPATLLKGDPAGRYEPQEIVDPSGGRWVITENNAYDARTQINTMRYYYRRLGADGIPFGPEREARLRLRVLFARELERWLHLAGLTIVEDWDDYARVRPFSGEGTRRIFAARPR
jgi:SAM-dependent methyltransferase